jgi:hypothetical protein
MTTQLEHAANMLFPSEGNQAANIKFFRGRSRPISAERLAQQFVQAEKQIATGATAVVDNIDD